MKRVLYFTQNLAHFRCFESFEEDARFKSKFLCFYPGGEFKSIRRFAMRIRLRDRKCVFSIDKAVEEIAAFNPDVLVVSDFCSAAVSAALRPDCKRVYVHHGILQSYAKELKWEQETLDCWRGFDLYCGATKAFQEWVRFIRPDIQPNQIIDACPQLDLLCGVGAPKTQMIPANLDLHASKVLLFFPFELKDYSNEATTHLEDYFWVCTALESIARRSKWVVLVKLKPTKSDEIDILNNPQLTWGKQYVRSYEALRTSKSLGWLDPLEPAYEYLKAADLVVLTGTSTLELEAALAHKPLVLINTEGDPYFNDPLKSVQLGIAKSVSNRSVPELEEAITLAMFDNDQLRQSKFLQYHGIRTGSTAHLTIQDALARL